MISFREMKPDDAAAVEEVEKASFSMPWSRKSFWEEAANERTYYLLALDDGKVIGYAGTWILDDEAQITNVAVAPCGKLVYGFNCGTHGKPSELNPARNAASRERCRKQGTLPQAGNAVASR